MRFWREYVPVAQRRAQARQKMDKLRKQGKDIQPVEIEGRTIARSFWGKGWCDHLESFSDYANRLPRGRTYARNGSVCHLGIQSGRIEAMVSGSSLYTVTIGIKKLKPALWNDIKKQCSGQIGSMLELLQGKLSNQVMTVVTDRDKGLFPKPGEIQLSCSCPDWAVMCKHVAAVLYGVGNRLDTQPELLFQLRDVDAGELIAAEMALPGAATQTEDSISQDALGDIFGVDFDTDSGAGASPSEEPAQKSRGRKKEISRGKRNEKGSVARSRSNHTKKQSIPTRQAKKRARTRIADEAPPRTKAPAIRPTGKSVARLRKKMGLTVPEFAKALGVTPASVTRWESTHGRLQLRERSLNALAELHSEAKKT